MHDPIGRAPDPRGPLWLKSPPLKPGGTGEKFTIAAVKLFFTFSFSVSVLPHKYKLKYVLWTRLLRSSGVLMTILIGNRP